MSKKKSVRSVSSMTKSEDKVHLEIESPPMDTLIIKILSLRCSDLDVKNYAIKVTFCDQLLVHASIPSIHARDVEPTHEIACGSMIYDPSDYEKMCLFADSPLVVQIQPLGNIDRNQTGVFMYSPSWTIIENSEPTDYISYCNVDILLFFLDMKDQQKMYIKKRMEPMTPRTALRCKSWDTLPLLTMELIAQRDSLNAVHHQILKNANWMKFTLIAAYNMYIPFEDDYVYSAATKMPLRNDTDGDTNIGVVTYSQGYGESQKFDGINFYPKWESLRCLGEVFTQSDQKFQCKLEEIQNENKIDLPYYMNKTMRYYTSVWGSFHRNLMLNSDKWLWKHLRNHKWPVEIHIYGENGGYSFMAFLNLFKLLYPGERTIRLAVPLQWMNAESMMNECGCDPLLTPNDRPPSIFNDRGDFAPSFAQGSSKPSKHSVSTMATGQWRPTGADENDAFVLVEVKFRRSLKPIIVPPRILKVEMFDMLTQMELNAPKSRKCTGRGQQEHEWSKTVRNAANSLKKVPYYGATELCIFNRQLSGTRTRVQLTTSFWQEAATFVNNHFVIQHHLKSADDFEELIMMAHACLMKSASNTLMRTDQSAYEAHPVLRAARYARQMQDTRHAMEIYLQLVVENPRNANYWRELSTCLKDIDRDWATVCLNEAIVINPRHPLTLISKGAMLFEENPSAAEPFFIALLTFHPTWTSVWTIASVYFFERELFQVAKVIMKIAEKWGNLRCREDVTFQRVWEHELGDWWDCTPLLPGMSLYFDAADLLLRLRAVPLAEVCMARVLSVAGESAQYYHMVGLCCRLRGDFQDALCHLSVGLQKFGEVNYLKSLEAEVQHRLGNFKEAIISFGKSGNFCEPFSTLMSLTCGDNQRARTVLLDLVRRRPSAHAWTALAEDWLNDLPSNQIECEGEPINVTAVQARSYAIACALQALKIDRQAGRAWAILSKLVKPSAKRSFCYHMASICGWKIPDEDIQITTVHSQNSFCHDVGTRLRECQCNICDKTRV